MANNRLRRSPTGPVQNLYLPINVVRDFGADPTGATDSTAAIQAAIDAALAVDGDVHWPAGDYDATGALTNLYNVRHSGPGLLTYAGRVHVLDPSLDPGDLRRFGGVEGAADNTAAMTAARTAMGTDKPVIVPEGDFGATKLNNTTSSYGATYKDALGRQMLLGTTAAPTTRAEPVLWVEKVSDATRTVNPAEWDQGAIYGSLEKVGGTAYSAAVTGYCRAAGSTTYDAIGLQGRAQMINQDAGIWGVWAYADIAVEPLRRAIGMEINIRNTSGVALTYNATAAAGAISGLVVATADGTAPGTGHEAVGIAQNTGGGWLIGLNIREGAIVKSDGSGDGEAIRIAGASSNTLRYGGIRIGASQPHMDYGIRTSEATFGDNAAFHLGENQRIVWGAAKSSSTRIRIDGTVMYCDGVAVDISAPTGELRIAGTKVIDARITGWDAATGTATRTTFATNTVTTEELAERVKALIDDLRSHGLIGT